MTAYFVAQMEIKDPDRYKAYLAGFMPVFERHGGKLLATSATESTVIEGDWGNFRTVILSFPTREAAESWVSDPDYVKLAEIRKATARTNMVLLDGVPDH